MTIPNQERLLYLKLCEILSTCEAYVNLFWFPKPTERIIHMGFHLKIYRNPVHPPVLSPVSTCLCTICSGHSISVSLCLCVSRSASLWTWHPCRPYSPQGGCLFPSVGHDMKIDEKHLLNCLCFSPIKIKPDEWNHLFTFFSKRTELNNCWSYRSLTLRCSVVPLTRGPQKEMSLLRSLALGQISRHWW